MDHFILGLDLGQQSDYSALAVVEVVSPPPIEHVDWRGAITHTPSKERPTLLVRHLERWALGTRYPRIVQAVGERMRALTTTAHQPRLIVDATGVGRPVTDMFAAAGIAHIPLTITSGGSWSWVDGGVHVAKMELVAVVQSTLQTGRLQVSAALPDVTTLTSELLNFHYKITAAANITYESWRESAHDDLVLAVAMATWWAERMWQPPWTTDDVRPLSYGRAI